MSIDRQHGKIIMECDECTETKEGDGIDFHVFIEEAKKEGWAVSKILQEWQHICPGCLRSMAEEMDYE
jgi:hypothetical protein